MAVLFFLLLSAVWFDIRTFRIPNVLIVMGMTAGTVYRICYPEGKQILYYLLSFTMMLFLLLPCFKLKVIGGGDVKLLCVCALICGFKQGVSVVIDSFFFGAIISVCYLVYHQICSKQKIKRNHVIHFSIPIFLGVVAEQLWGGVLWQIF